MAESKRTYFLLLVMCIFFASILAFNTHLSFYMDNDTFWHIKTGEYIFTRGEIPKTDVFSWYGAENGLKWINHEWLFDFLVYAVHSGYGLKGVVVFSSIVSGILFCLLYIYIRIRTKNEFLSLLLTIAGIFGAVGFLSPRPHLISYCLFLGIAILLERKEYIWVLPVIIIGVNVHGGFYPMYVLLLTYYLWREKPFIVLLSVCAAVINPYGVEMLSYPFKVQMYADFSRYIMEWGPTKLAGRGAEYYLVSYIILLILIFNKKIKWEDALFSLLIAAQTFMAIRHIVFLYLIVIPILSPYIAQNKLFTDIKEAFNKRIRYAYVGALLVLFSLYVYKTDFSRPVNLRNFPSEQAINFIKDNKLERIGNMYNDGGFLIYSDIKPMIDGRADIFAPIYNETDLFRDHFRADLLEDDYKKFLDNYKVEYIIINKKRPIYRATQHDSLFTNVYEDDLYIILKYMN